MLDLKTRKALLIGTVGDGPMFAFGGSDKIKALNSSLSEIYGSVDVLSTYGWKKHPIHLLNSIRKSIPEYDDLFVVLSTNGTRYLCPFILRWAKKSGARVFYAMVGIGNLEEEVRDDPNWDKITELIQNKNLWNEGDKRIGKILRGFDALLVETNRLKDMCRTFYGVDKAFVLPNNRDYSRMFFNDKQVNSKNIKFVYFASITKGKGADLALKAANILLQRGINNFSLDFYGRKNDSVNSWFDVNAFPSNINYRGVCLKNKLDVLRTYDCLIFPSIYVEGVPGTIVDARFASLPVVASNFTFADEIVNDGIDGLIFERKNANDLADKMAKLISDPSKIADLSKKSFERSSFYTNESCNNIILEVNRILSD